jgi:hypothetical protein
LTSKLDGPLIISLLVVVMFGTLPFRQRLLVWARSERHRSRARFDTSSPPSDESIESVEQ